MIYFCTLFDHRYLDRGISLHASLLKQGQPFHLWILCMDEYAYRGLSARVLQNVTLVTVEDLAGHDHDVRTACSNRSLVEFYFTIKSFLCLYILDTEQQVDLITYLDADLYFFGRPTAITDEMTGYSIGITQHRFPPHARHGERYGLFNAGFVSIRRDDDGMSALRWWRNSCFTWCHDYVSEGRFADQGYLDSLPRLFQNVRIITNKGINAAPWNISQYVCRADGNTVRIDEDTLILYHFHGIKKLYPCLYDSGLTAHHSILHSTVRRSVYKPYLEELYTHRSQEHYPRSQESIRVTPGRLDMLKRIFPPLWKSLYRMKDFVTGCYYRSLIVFCKT